MFSASCSRITRLKSPVRSVSTRCFPSFETAAASFNCAASLPAWPGLAMKQWRMTIMRRLLTVFERAAHRPPLLADHNTGGRADCRACLDPETCMFTSSGISCRTTVGGPVAKIGCKVLIATLLCGLLTAGCGGSSGSSGSGAQNLIIYTGRDKAEVDAVIAMFQQKFPQYKNKVASVVLGAQEELERLRAEKDNPQAGFLWGGTQQGLQQAADEGLLAPSQPTHADLLEASRKDPQGRWYAEMLL